MLMRSERVMVVMLILLAILWLSNPTRLQHPVATNPFLLAAELLIKLSMSAIFGGLYWSLRRLINFLHCRKYGTAHPSLAASEWVL